MPKTFTTQSHLFPSSGTTGWQEGDGVNAREMTDLAEMLNNLLGYCDPRAGYSQSVSSATPGFAQQQLHTASREIYLVQKPIVIPHLARRMWYGAGMGAQHEGAGTTDLTAMTVYLSATPYTGAAPPTAFETSNLSKGYRSASRSLSISTTSTQYQFVDNSGIGFVPPHPDGAQRVGKDILAYLIVTVTGFGGTTRLARIWDFTQWFVWD